MEVDSKRDLANHLLRKRFQPLDVLFAPHTVAVIGATETAGSVGRTVLWNLITNTFGGTVFPVNPKRASVLGIQAYPTILDVPADVDLAVVVTPAPTVPDVIGQCVQAGVKGVIIISAGFKECGSDGTELEQRVREQLQRGNMRAIGPNCLGIMNPHSGLNATFAAGMVRPGSVGFISQSGALLTAILDWSLAENVGFSSFISVGTMLDVGWGDLIDYLGDDPRTKAILIYMESIGDARSFLSAAREVARQKPVIVIKAGRTSEAAKAAASHTGSLTGSDEVLDAAFRRCGVLRVNSIAELFYMAEALAKQPRPHGPRLTILTNAGGPGVLATDALIANRGQLAPLAEDTLAALDQLLPAQWSHNNPIDILGDADPARYAQAVDLAIKNPQSDGLLVVLTPQAMTDPTQTAEQLKPYAKAAGKPILASWMGGGGVAAGVSILNRAEIPTFPYPDTAARVFNYMWRYSYNLEGLYETPQLSQPDDADIDQDRAAQLILAARQSGRTLLTELESKLLLEAYQIPTVTTRVAKSESEAVQLAQDMGFPVVLKLHSETITHKTDVGGVQLNLPHADAVCRAYRDIETSVGQRAGPQHFQGVTVQPMISREGYEIILGSSIDPQFGPVLLFGAGGQLVEVVKDRALALPPLNSTLALRMMEQTRIFAAFQGLRGRPPVDVAALAQLLVRFSALVVTQRWIKEIDVNPLLVSHERSVALDARVILFGPDIQPHQLPALAIRPYPTQYASTWTSPNGQGFTIRPIRPEDEGLLVRFHETLSEHSVYMRYFQTLGLGQRVAHERLSRLCFIDYGREMALVADSKNPQTGEHEIVGVGRLIRRHDNRDAEFALLVTDRYQRCGLGTELLRRLVQVGRDDRRDRITADILRENRGMQRVCEKLGFQLQRRDDETVRAVIDL